MHLLLDAIEQTRVAHGLTRHGMARAAGIDPGQFHRFYQGKQGLGPRTLGRLARRFPELAPYVLLFLQSNIAHSNGTSANRNSTATGHVRQEPAHAAR